jgi:hypothetical protein
MMVTVEFKIYEMLKAFFELHKVILSSPLTAC